MEKYDFSGWATKNNLKCSDGRTILKDAFKHYDGVTVPIVWNHQHDDADNVLGHALLENRENGVYAYGKLNETPSGKIAKILVDSGDITALSIYANKLKQQNGNVIHGDIKEVSLVIAGANPEAFIDSVTLEHGDSSEEEAIIYTGEEFSISHSDYDTKQTKEEPMEDPKNEPKPDGEETVEDVFNTLNEKQKTVVYAMIGAAMDGKKNEEQKEGKEDMKHNLFDGEDQQDNKNVLSHSDMKAILDEAKRYGSLKDSAEAHNAGEVLFHSDDNSYGISNIDYLFPEAKTLSTPPSFISRDMGWVSKIMAGVHKTPFSKIKSIFANITEDDARAKGYFTGNLKKEEVFSLLKRTTSATTIYKKQKMDKESIIEITDFDVVAWIKGEMRTMLDEELARAFLIGDGRSSSSDDKINADNIRPIWTDDALYTVKKKITFGSSDTSDKKAKTFIQAVVRSRKDYKGSGNPILFTTEDMLTDCLLMEDTNGRVIYDSVEKLATAMRVKEIITVQPMENCKRTGTSAVDGDTSERTLRGIIVNLNDYNVGADKGGAVSMFEDFDIDYNQEKYLIETRCSGALIKPYSAIAIESVAG